jgi:hypothetical protein
MDRMTLREAAERTSRSITTLRRYIRSGRLHAEKRNGRFGPEYFVSERDLAGAGLETESVEPVAALAPRPTSKPRASRRTAPVPLPAHESVPLSLFQDLQLKHEQLLVQYGMMRSSGLRALEARSELEQKEKQLDGARARAAEIELQLRDEAAQLKKQLREALLELEGRSLEIDALQEKVRALEMLNRNAATTESIERQFHRIVAQTRRVSELSKEHDWPTSDNAAWPAPSLGDPKDH